MGFKARELEGMSKAELIKALRASVAREAKLQKRIAALEDQASDLKSGARLDALRIDKALASAPPAFPWDVK